MGWYGGGAGWAMMIGNVLVLALLIGVVVWAVTRVAPGGPGWPERGEPSAREVLDRRLASGEIDVATHRALVEELSRPGRAVGPG
ncbi:SHOCT domain-containing protein [Thalassiella azotivora]